MLINLKRLAFGSALAVLMTPAMAAAQAASGDELMAMDRGSLRAEIQSRYDSALGLTRDAAVVSASDTRFIWASQAKAQCGIALGFLKSGTKDPVSVGKCADAAWRMQGTPRPAVSVQPPTVTDCNRGPFIVFFDWDRSEITVEATTVLDSMVAAYAGCGTAPIALAGYADRSGGDAYNLALSDRRAAAVRSYLMSRSVGATAIVTQGFGEANPRVPTADGVRELQNRRVEIVVQ